MDYHNQMKNRSIPIKGQLRGILRLMEAIKDSKEVITSYTSFIYAN